MNDSTRDWGISDGRVCGAEAQLQGGITQESKMKRSRSNYCKGELEQKSGSKELK